MRERKRELAAALKRKCAQHCAGFTRLTQISTFYDTLVDVVAEVNPIYVVIPFVVSNVVRAKIAIKLK